MTPPDADTPTKGESRPEPQWQFGQHEALWSDPAPRTPEGQRLWQLFRDGKLGPSPSGIRDFGQRVCQIEAEAAALPVSDSEASGLRDDETWLADVPKYSAPDPTGQWHQWIKVVDVETRLRVVRSALSAGLSPETDGIDVERLARAFEIVVVRTPGVWVDYSGKSKRLARGSTTRWSIAASRKAFLREVAAEYARLPPSVGEP